MWVFLITPVVWSWLFFSNFPIVFFFKFLSLTIWAHQLQGSSLHCSDHISLPRSYFALDVASIIFFSSVNIFSMGQKSCESIFNDTIIVKTFKIIKSTKYNAIQSKESWSEKLSEKFQLVSMGGRAEGLACADPGARTPRGALAETSGNFR